MSERGYWTVRPTPRRLGMKSALARWRRERLKRVRQQKRLCLDGVAPKRSFVEMCQPKEPELEENVGE